MILDHQQAKSGMPTGGINTRNGLKKLSGASRGSSSDQEDHNNQPLNETVENSVGGASSPDSRKSSKQSLKGQDAAVTAEVARVDSARGSKKRKIEEISNEDANASSPSQSRKKMLRASPTKEELVAKDEFVSLPSVYLKPSSSQDAGAAPVDSLNLDSLKSALPEDSATVILIPPSSSSDD
jgi:hypothetical protein